MPKTSKLAPPFAAGSGGPSFEAQVQASFLASMLLKARCPCATTGEIVSLRLQAKEAGADTDDLLAILQSEDGIQFRLLAQIKHGITFAAGNQAFQDTIHAAWADFNKDSFQRGSDRIVIISDPQSRKVINHVRPLLDWARGSATAQEFYGKARRELFSSQQRVEFLEALGKILFDGSIPPEQEDAVWKFIKALYLLQYDFDSQESQSLALVLSLLELAKSPSCQESAHGLWAQHITLVQEFNRDAATITREVLGARLTPALREAFAGPGSTAGVLVEKLREHTQLNLGDISTEVARGVHIQRSELEDELVGLLAERRIVIVTGLAGSGKSALAKGAIARLASHAPSFLFKAKEFQHPNLHQFLNAFLTNQSFAHLSSRIALFSPKILWVESAEQLLEINPSDAFGQLLREIKNDESWRMILTCRAEALSEVLQTVVMPFGLDWVHLRVPELTVAELASVTDQLPQLADYMHNSRLAEIFRNPFYLHLACTLPFEPKSAGQPLSVIQFQQALCKRAVERPSVRQDRLNSRRYETFIRISEQRARSMVVMVPARDHDHEAVAALVKDGLLTEDGQHCVAPAHDLFEDWAIGEFIEREFTSAGGNWDLFREAVGPQPAMRRAFRKWLVSAFETCDPHRLTNFVVTVALDNSLSGYWRDDALVGVMMSERAELFFSAVRSDLLAPESPLLSRVMHLLHIACKGPNQKLLDQLGLTGHNAPGVLNALFTQPIGGGWAALFNFLRQHWLILSETTHYKSLSVLSEWASSFDQFQVPDQAARDCAQLALTLYLESSQLPGHFRGDEKAAEAALTLCTAIPDELRKIYSELLKLENDEHVTRDPLVEGIFKIPTTTYLSRVLPDVVIATVEKFAFLGNKSHRGWYERYDIESRYGLNSGISFDQYPASAYYGPFWYLLTNHPKQAVPFIIRFLNRAVVELVRQEPGYEEDKVTLRLNDGSMRQLYWSTQLWCMYRASQTGSKLMESALMALEKWLLDSTKVGVDVRWAIEVILLNSNSVAPIAVLGSVAVSDSSIFHEGLLPILRTYEFYFLDKQRLSVEDCAIPAGNTWDAWGQIFSNERLEEAKRPHRKEELEDFIVRLQFSPHRDLINHVIATLHDDLAQRQWTERNAAEARIFLRKIDVSTFKYEQTEDGVLFQPTITNPHDAQMSEVAGQRLQQMGLMGRLQKWANAAVCGSPEATEVFRTWEEASQAALELEACPEDENTYSHRNLQVLAHVAAGLVVLAGSSLDKSQFEWCFRQIEIALLEYADSTESDKQVGIMPSHGSRPSAFVLPLLLKFYPERKENILALFGIAITHAVEQVQDYAVAGISRWLWATGPKLAMRCFDAVIGLGAAKHEALEEFRRQQRLAFDTAMQDITSDEERVVQPGYDVVVQNLRNSVRTAIAKREELPYSIPSEDLLDRVLERNLTLAVQMLPARALDDELMIFLGRLFKELLDNEIENNHYRGPGHPEKLPYFLQIPLLGKVADCMLMEPLSTTYTLEEVLKDGVARCPSFAAEVLDELLSKEINLQSGQRFWELWIACGRIALSNPALQRSRYVSGQSEACRIISTLLFARFDWPSNLKRWEPLVSNTRFVEDAIDAVGGTSCGFRSLCVLLNSIGFFMLPDALIRLYRVAKDVPSSKLFDERDSKVCLEILIRGIVFSMTARIREHEGLRESTLHFLDRLVDSGSPAAYQMRELVVSPLRPVDDLCKGD